MYRPGSVGESAYGGAYGGYGDEFASAFAGLALGGEQAPGSPAFGAYAQPVQAAPPMSPRAAGQEAFNDASAHAESMFAEQDVHWLRAAYGQAFDPERLLAGEAVLADQGRAPSSPGYHSLYKTELCRSYEETSTCRYGNKCQFAHGQDELRPVMRHPRYKTELCRTFATSGTCPYGTRCRFIHYRGAAPVAAAPPGSGGAKLTVTVPPGSPRSPRVTPFIRGAGTPPASPGEIAGGAGPGSPPASPRQPPQMHSSLVPEGAPRHGGPGRSGNIANRVAPETPPCTPPRSGGSGASPRDNDSSGGNGNGSSNGSSGSEDSGGGLAKSRSRLPFFQTLCTAAGGKEAAAGAPAELAAAGAPTAPRSPKKGSPPPKMPPPAPNRAAMQRRGAVCD